MAEVSFWGGVGIIGSSKILVEQDGWRVLLDLGLDFSPGQGLYRGGVAPRAEHSLRDRLRTQGAPWIPHLYRPDATRGLGLASGSDGKTALFVTHGHIDHIGLTGFVDGGIPIYCSPETARLMTSLAQAGEGLEGGEPSFIPLHAHHPVSFGPFTITRYDVDHDVVGASGYGVETEDGVLAFTGDIRLHGRFPEKSLGFAHAVAGARALVIEGTTLSFGFQQAQKPEVEVDRSFDSILGQTPGLALLTMYPRNLERVKAFLNIAQAHGRQILWPEPWVKFFEGWGLSGLQSWDQRRVAEVQEHPERYVVQLLVRDLPWLLDLPTGPGAVFLHANGEPLGPFDPAWDLLQDWLRHTHTPFWPIGTGGHASPDDLNHLVEIIHPDILFPLHSQEPDRLIPPPGTLRWLPQRGGRRYPLGGR